MSYIYLDGAIVHENEAKISVLNRGFLFGDGVYATIQVLDGQPLFLPTHLERLKTQAKSFGLEIPEINAEDIFALIEKNQALHGVWKLKVIAVAGEEPEMRLRARLAKHILFLLHPFSVPSYHPLSLTLYPYPVMTTHTSFKSLAHLSRYFVMEYGLKNGADDALTTTPEGFLLEASFGNLFWVEGKRLFTPDVALPLHFGVTISQVVEIANDLQLEVHLVKKPLSEISEEAFLFRCNTMSEIRPIARVGTRSFQRDPALEKAFLDAYTTRKHRFRYINLGCLG